jgi:double-stranded uracil-DNA glycosylase
MTTPSPTISPEPGGLDPVAGRDPVVLILGSYPSVKSLDYHEYYGNPKNHFWNIIEELFSIPKDLPYLDRTRRLAEHNIALWDTLRYCEREGSADNRIQNPVPNDIAGFVRAHPSLRLIALNGRTAERYFKKFAGGIALPVVTLPSTSPANAAVPFAGKVRAWRIIRLGTGSE